MIDMRLRSIKDVKNLKGKKVFLRVDFNAPWRLERTMPTIKYLLDAKAKVTLATHLTKSGSTKPFAAKLDRQIKVLENLRANPGEEKNDPAFAKKLAVGHDLYVNDAFAVDHRAHASLVAITKFLPSFAGLLLEDEVAHLSKLLVRPARPFALMLGGAKISTKIGVIKNLHAKADAILLGGGLVNTILAARGYAIGASLVDAKEYAVAEEIVRLKKVMLPSDVVIGNANRTNTARVVKLNWKKPHLVCEPRMAIFDIGPDTIRKYAETLKDAQTLVWNGPMGKFEIPTYSHGTVALGRIFAARSSGRSYGVAGGGETIEALAQTGMSEYVDWVSTGGGAMLAFLEGGTLPGLKPLIK